MAVIIGLGTRELAAEPRPRLKAADLTLGVRDMGLRLGADVLRPSDKGAGLRESRRPSESGAGCKPRGRELGLSVEAWVDRGSVATWDRFLVVVNDGLSAKWSS